MSKISAVEGITIDKDGQKVIIHDADEAKLAALGKKRTALNESKLTFRGNGSEFQHLLDARDVFLYHCYRMMDLFGYLMMCSGKLFLQSWLLG